MSSGAPATRPLPSPWIFGPAVDLLIGCGAWSLPLLAVTFYFNQTHADVVATLFYLLAVFCNQPHYMATVYRAYRTTDDFRKYRFFTVYVTLFAVLTALIVHYVPSLFPWLLTLYLTWSPWHYTGQNFGIAMMLARRAGAAPTEDTRRLLWWAYFAAYVAWFLSMHHADAANQPGLHLLPVPEKWAWLGKLFFLNVYLIAGSVALWRLIRATSWKAMTGPLALYATQFLWFLLPEILRASTDLQLPESYSNAGILAFMHCAQYLWITSYYARRETESSGASPSAATRMLPAFRWGSYYLLLVLGGIALFLPAPWLASRLLGHDLVESILIFTALINLHHFILDGAIWKLRDGRIARLLLGRNAPGDEPHEDAGASPLLGLSRWLIGPAVPARLLRYGLAALLIALALVDQLQFRLTQRTAVGKELALAERINPRDTRIYYQRARERIAANDIAAALAQLRQAVAINPYNLPVQHLLGELLFRTNDPAAPSHFERMTTLFPEDPAGFFNRGLLASRAGDRNQAIAHFEMARQLGSAEPLLLLNLGNAYEKRGEIERALDYYSDYVRIIGDEPETVEALGARLQVGLKVGELHQQTGDATKAAEWYRQTAILARSYFREAEAELAESRLRTLASP